MNLFFDTFSLLHKVENNSEFYDYKDDFVKQKRDEYILNINTF